MTEQSKQVPRTESPWHVPWLEFPLACPLVYPLGMPSCLPSRLAHPRPQAAEATEQTCWIPVGREAEWQLSRQCVQTPCSRPNSA